MPGEACERCEELEALLSIYEVAMHIHSKLEFTLDLLQQNIADMTYMTTEDGLMLIAGDFNAHTSDAQDSLTPEDLSGLLNPFLRPMLCMTLALIGHLGPRNSEHQAHVFALASFY